MNALRGETRENLNFGYLLIGVLFCDVCITCCNLVIVVTVVVNCIFIVVAVVVV